MTEKTMPVAGTRSVFLALKGSLIGASVLLLWDVALMATFLMSYLACPVWFVLSLVKNVFERPGWTLALARVGMPALILAVALANHRLQLRTADANGRRVVAACESYQAAHGRFPRKLQELVPEYFESVPPAKYCLGPPGAFFYVSSDSGPTFLVWQVIPPYDRRLYNFETREWRYYE